MSQPECAKDVLQKLSLGDSHAWLWKVFFISKFVPVLSKNTTTDKMYVARGVIFAKQEKLFGAPLPRKGFVKLLNPY
jgi:hypothetical protein